jgi:hypothetical protein
MIARLCCVLLLVVAAGSYASGAAEQASLEYDVKAAFVLNFTRYVEWPTVRHTPPFRLCVLRDNPFNDRLSSIVAGEKWQDGSIDVHMVSEVRAAQACHLLYVPATAHRAFVDGQPLLHGQPVLTIGEHASFLDRDGMIRLFVDDNKVRFSINQRAASAAGLQISSRLLRLAREVVGSTGAR